MTLTTLLEALVELNNYINQDGIVTDWPHGDAENVLALIKYVKMLDKEVSEMEEDIKLMNAFIKERVK